GHGTGELLDHLVRRCAPSDGAGSDTAPALTAAILGRQNVGKSSLLNAMLREERVVVSSIPGTTRDAVDTLLTFNGERLCLIDTAGLRHRRKVRDPVDTFSMSRTMGAIDRCDIALVVLDATLGVTNDDQRIVTHVCRKGRGLALLANKWDLVKGGSERALVEGVRRALPFASFAPVIAVSATTGFQVPKSLALTFGIVRAMRTGIDDNTCEELLRKAWAARTPPRWLGRAIRFRAAHWRPGRPVRLELLTAPIGRLPVPYQHYLLKRLHAHPKLSGIPVQLVIRKHVGERVTRDR
ncbi:MAG: GTP-binding protein, partial [Gemmatimonadetes bacterium]|nr:GTP-binding protein [Gemmatimonadota bacterium]